MKNRRRHDYTREQPPPWYPSKILYDIHEHEMQLLDEFDV